MNRSRLEVRHKNAKPQKPATRNGIFETTSPKFGMPSQLRRSANWWQESACGVRGTNNAAIPTATAMARNGQSEVRTPSIVGTGFHAQRDPWRGAGRAWALGE